MICESGILGWIEAPPSGIALIEPDTDKQWRFSDLSTAIKNRARRMSARTKGVVACVCDQSAESVMAYFAAMYAGHAALLLDETRGSTEISRLIELYDADFVIDSKGIIERRESRRGPRVFEHLSLLLPTSGSTGSSKYARISWENLQSNTMQINASLEINEEQRAVVHLPICYAYGLSIINSHFAAGASVVLPGISLVDRRFWEHFKRYSGTSLAGVPYTFDILKKIDFWEINIPTLKTLTQAGGRLDPVKVVDFNEHMVSKNGRMVVMYGQTEATARMSYLPPHLVSEKPDSVGIPVLMGDFVIAGDGELIYSGPNVSLGYADSRADLELGDENNGVLATGDLGAVDNEGFYSILGRKRRIAKICGKRINLDELESFLSSSAEIAIVETSGRLSIFIEGSKSGNDPHRFLQRQIGRKVGIPFGFIRVYEVDSLPRTNNGKLNYQKLERSVG